jgi:adenine-specific DNA-methyltransferase
VLDLRPIRLELSTQERGDQVARSKKLGKGAKTAGAYQHPEAKSLLRPDIGVQPQFKKKKPPVKYRYDSSLSPALQWDENPARERGEALIREILEATSRTVAATGQLLDKESAEALRATAGQARSAAERLKALSKPFLDWAGKVEHAAFEVPTLPLFVHERLSTKAIIETLKGHKIQADLFGDPRHSIADQVLKAYEYRDNWVNRMILGDSLAVMNSLLHFEGLGGQVQMIYIDPPYGVKFGSNFQPFVRKRDVSHNDDEDMTREPEMVQAYRDTWELGLHSYLTYMRDRLLLARELLSPSGSVFVQISDENLHHVRELMDEVLGPENKLGQISFLRGGSQTTAKGLAATADFLLWYARDGERAKTHDLLLDDGGWAARSQDMWIELPDHNRQRFAGGDIPSGARLFTHRSLESARETGSDLNKFAIAFDGRDFWPKRGWSTTPQGAERLKETRRLLRIGNSLRFIVYLDDFPLSGLTANWTDTIESGFAADKFYVVQTAKRVVQRCMLMTTDPGDLVLDPTCGSGTTAYVAEQWGRRWITIDTSRVPLALARQRLLTATFPYYQLKDEARGPAGGFVYERKQNAKGEEVGGIVPHITLKSIANNEPPEPEVLVDRPEVSGGITRVSGPFCVEATIPTTIDYEADGGGAVKPEAAESTESYASFIERMIEVLRRSPVIQLGGNKPVKLKNVRPPAKTLVLSAEAIVENGNGNGKSVAIVFGPENGAISEKLVFEAAREARAKDYAHLYVIGFAIQPNARLLIDKAEETVGIAATYAQATPDLAMGDLLKNLRSSQIFSVCGMPDVALRKLSSPKGKVAGGEVRYEVELLGLDVFDPETMEPHELKGGDVPAWFLDTDYNALCFHVSQAFFPRTGAWDNLKKALRGAYEESVWDHLAGATSAPFEAGEHGQIAVKVIDDRGNELMVVKDLKEAR